MLQFDLNKYQTPVNEEFFKGVPEEVKEQFLLIFNSVPFVQSLTESTREYAINRPKDKNGKIIIDLAKPHILENMDYFRPTAIHYQKHGRFTNLRPNANPNSEYGKWVREELDRCWNGMVRPSDGEWVTGHLYFYMNYCPIIQSQIVKGTKKANRIVDFPESWEGIYLRFHYMEQARSGGLYNNFQGGNHGAEMASRGKSKSYSMSSILAHNFVVGEDAVSKKKVISLVTAYQKEYLIKDGVLNKFVLMVDFLAENTQFPRKRLKNSYNDMTWIMGFKDAELDIEKGTLNSVMGISSKDDSSKLRGKRAVFIGIEEFGTFPRLLDLYNVLLPSVQEGEYVFGLLYLQGTAGDNDSDFAGAQEIMYNPKGYNMYALPNVYDKVNQGKKNFVFFFPGYMNKKGCYNQDGVSDVTLAIKEILLARHNVKYNSSDPNTLLKTISEIPITPAEAIIRVGVNMFPVTEITETILQLDNDPNALDSIYTGNLTMHPSGAVDYKMTDDKPIRNFPHKDNKLAGAIEIIKMPERNSSGNIYDNRYILGCDPYDDDVSNTKSLGSIFVLDLWTDKIVAEYTGRPPMADDFYEICRRLTVFYNGCLNYENNKKGLFAYFKKMNCTYLLTDVLEFLRDKDMIKGEAIGNKAKGTIATPHINSYALTLLRTWLLRPHTEVVENDEEENVIKSLNLHHIKNRAFLQELMLFNNEGNYDRVSAMGMVMLLRESKLIQLGDTRPGETTEPGLETDDFFNVFDNMVNNKHL